MPIDPAWSAHSLTADLKAIGSLWRTVCVRGHFRTKAERSALAVGRPGQM